MLQYEGSGPLKCVAPRTRWPVFWAALGYFLLFWAGLVLVLALTPTFVPAYRVRGFHLVLAGIAAWLLGWGAFMSFSYSRLRLTEDSLEPSVQLIARRAAACPQNFAIQEVDLLSSATSAISVAVSVVCWLRDDRPDGSGEFWTSSTVWPSPQLSNSSNFSSAGAIQAALAQTCPRGHAPVLHVSSRTFNSTVYHSYDIGTPSVAGEGWGILSDWWYLLLRLDEWYAIIWVLSVSLLLQCNRARNNRVLGAADATYDAETPDYTRWAEYALTSPVQVYIVALNLSRKQDELLWMLMGAQAMLMLVGYLIELCLYLKWCGPEPRAAPAGWPGGPGSGSGSGSGSGLMLAHLPVESHLFRVGCAAAASDDRPPKDVSISYRSIVFLLVSAFWWHGLIWRVLVEAFVRSERQFNQCQQQQVPEFVVWLLATQCTLFTLFGLVQLVMVLFMARHNACCVWRWGSMSYSILSVTAKTTLDVLFIAGTVWKE